ncbi:MAG: dethiobiotin synthase [Deltaproteobacteria bacterium]|nr:dethiobiotin synthase [Deltaproteobacteria bacterium]
MSDAIPCLFVVGTGTDVGKTMVAALLVEALGARAVDVAVSKPLASGCARQGGRLIAADAIRLGRALGLRGAALARAHDVISPWRAAAPLAPGLALARPPSVAELVRHLVERARGRGALLVEGAGGLVLPYARNGTVLDLLGALRRQRALHLSVLLVGAAGLGTINHTCLSVAALRAAGLEPHGVLLSRGQRAITPDERGNPAAIARLGAVALPVVVPHVVDDASHARARRIVMACVGDRRGTATRRQVR